MYVWSILLVNMCGAFWFHINVTCVHISRKYLVEATEEASIAYNKAVCSALLDKNHLHVLFARYAEEVDLQ